MIYGGRIAEQMFTGDITTGAGNDLIYAGAGAENIDGGAGFDTVYYSASHTVVVADLESRVQQLEMRAVSEIGVSDPI